MKTTNRPPVIQAPHLRKRGTTSNTPPNVSQIPTRIAAAWLRSAGTLAWIIRVDQPSGSVIFQTPDTMKRAATITAALTLSKLFHAGTSSALARKEGCAILSSMLPILALFVAASAVQPADLVVVNAHIYTGNPAQPEASSMA